MTNQPQQPTENDATASDLTVLRGNTGSGSGEADAPRVLKQRFVLEAKLGSGGMGTVYRAKDLRKVEARDRDPYLAVKVLNNDFRSHPDAFVALQREAAKSQTLSHPNIVSIYDFDKDGDIPFMTMELLKGRELGELLTEYPNGLPDALAWPVIEGMCAGLKRAHDAGITHADFKPGNVFVTEENGTKVLDFGIARAVRVNARFGDDTVFDPSKLAALTPAFASREMLAGDAPEPADDIYSLAVVVYLILSGRHPYQRVRADEAERQGLRPERLKKLSRRQWWVLERGLAFRAEQRPGGMDELIAGLVTRPALKPWMTAALLVVALGVGIGLSVGPLSGQRETVARDALTDEQVTRLDTLLAAPTFDPAWQASVTSELARLADVDVDAGGSISDQQRERALAVYLERIESSVSFEAALDVVRGADSLVSGGRYDLGYAALQKRVLADLEALILTEQFDRTWVDNVELQLLRFNRVFPGSTLYAELEQEVGDAYLHVIEGLAARGDLNLALELFALTAPRVFEYDELEAADARLVRLRAKLDQVRSVAIDSAAERELASDLESTAGFVCQRLDGPGIAVALNGLLERHPGNAAEVRSGVANRVAQCVAQLAETDQQRASELRDSALELTGPEAVLVDLKLDACSARHLVGAAGSLGSLAVCRDALAGLKQPGPGLVVVADGESRFAITRNLMSGSDAAVCSALECPRTGLEDSFTRAEALTLTRWLTANTGYTYRLPTHREWLRATDFVEAGASSQEVSSQEVSSQEISTQEESKACPLTVGGDLFAIEGSGIQGSRIGQAEWLDDDSAPVAVPTSGGATICTTAPERARLRLVREIQ